MDFKNIPAYKAVLGIILTGVVLIILVFLSAPPDTPYTSYNISDTDDIMTFLSDLGWESDSMTITVQNSVLPVEFDDVFDHYNALQLQQKCDLSKFAGKEITVYTVQITNYGKNNEHVYATVIVHNGTVIGGDIHSAELNGFMHTLK